MKNIYNLNDIKQFLFTQGYFWDGTIVDDSKKVTCDLFEEPVAIKLINKNYVKICVYAVVNNLKFELLNAEYDYSGYFDGYYPLDNLTNKWGEYLLNKYENYSDIIKEYCIKEEKKIKKELNEELQPLLLKAQILKDNAKSKLEYLNKLKSYVQEKNNTNNL